MNNKTRQTTRTLLVPTDPAASLRAPSSLDTPSIIRSGSCPPVKRSRCRSDLGKTTAKSLLLKNLPYIIRVGGYLAAALLFVLATSASAQGILTVVPTATVSTTAGTGVVGNTGNGTAATAATLADPSGVAYDAQGNLYLADAQNHVIREVSKTSGVITVIAGTGIEGYGGDGGPATLANLDTPTGVAVDSQGNVYIADSHNHRIREIAVGTGTLSTIAGTGTPGFSGDGSLSTLAQLDDPMGVAVDAGFNVYIADTNNQRIRKVSAGTITTIAGDGEELFTGDGGAATSAVLDSPTGVAVDASGNVYIADRHNQRIREITGTTITTIAGSGGASFSGSFTGDGATATAATLARPSGVSVDASGNVYIADTGNQRIRQLGGSAIATILGSGQQGYGGDTAAPAGINLNAPRAVAPDAVGNLAIPDKLNQRVRTAALPTLTYAADPVATLSPSQSVTLSNTGTASLTVTALPITGPFTTAPGGTCPALPIKLTPAGTCTQNIAFLPVTATAATGSVAFTGTGVVGQRVLLAGTGVPAGTATSLSSSLNPSFTSLPVTFTATVSPVGTGTVTFYASGTAISAPEPLTGGTATFTTTLLPTGSDSITAVYSGDANFLSSSSAALIESVLDFNFSIVSSGASGSGTQTVTPGGAATYTFNLAPLGGPFPFPVELSASGLPPGATATFTPNPITIGANPGSFTMTIQTARPTGALDRSRFFGATTISLGLLLLPLVGVRRRSRRWKAASFGLLGLLSLMALTGLSGCGTGSGFFGQSQATYTITVTGTAVGTGAVVLQHSTSVTLVVE